MYTVLLIECEMVALPSMQIAYIHMYTQAHTHTRNRTVHCHMKHNYFIIIAAAAIIIITVIIVIIVRLKRMLDLYPNQMSKERDGL